MSTEGLIVWLSTVILDATSKRMAEEAASLELERVRQEETLTTENMKVIMESETMRTTYERLIKASDTYASAIIGYADMLKRKMGVGGVS